LVNDPNRRVIRSHHAHLDASDPVPEVELCSFRVDQDAAPALEEQGSRPGGGAVCGVLAETGEGGLLAFQEVPEWWEVHRGDGRWPQVCVSGVMAGGLID